MDPNKIYRQQQEFENYIEEQKDNAIDLTDVEVNKGTNQSIRDLAGYLFNIPLDSLDNKLARIMPNIESVADIFSVLLELVLYGLDILSNSEADLFDITTTDQKEVEVIKIYFKSLGFTIEIKEATDFTKGYCAIAENKVNIEGWLVLDYIMLLAADFKFDNDSRLDQFEHILRVRMIKNIISVLITYVLYRMSSQVHPTNGKNVYFWSNQSQQAMILRTMMEREGILKFFHDVCVDVTPNVPSQVTETPALIVIGSNNFFVGQFAFKWFENIKQWALQQKMQMMSTQYAQSINNNLNVYDKLLGYSGSEMGGSSDSFSYYQTDKEIKTIDPKKDDVAAPQQFFNYNQIGTENIFTPPQEQDKIKSTSHTKLLRERAKERENTDKFVKESINEFASGLNK